jgi:large subunit ribosomal protein L3
MTPGLLGTKIGMTRIITDTGLVEPVTVIKAGPCVAMQIKTPERDGYHAVQLGFGDVKPHRSTLPQIGHASKARTGPKRFLREIRLKEAPGVQEGDVLTVGQFGEGACEYVDVTGVTKGKGFQGVMRRHGFGGMCSSHGTERKHRSAGGIGAHAPRGTGQSVKKGKRMAGHMGHVRSTIGPLRVLKVDPDNDLILVRGSIPGPAGGMVVIEESHKRVAGK